MKKLFVSIFIVVSLLSTGCASPKLDETPSFGLVGTQWMLVSLDNEKIQESKNSRTQAHIVFKDSHFLGHTGCNRIMGSEYSLKNSSLHFSKKGILLTRMFCAQSKEAEFIGALRGMRSYKIKGEFLELFDSKEVSLAKFKAKKIK